MKRKRALHYIHPRTAQSHTLYEIMWGIRLGLGLSRGDRVRIGVRVW